MDQSRVSVMETKRTSQVAEQNGMLPQARETLVLASRSPRRADILRAVEWPFEVEAADVDETLRGGESATHYVERLAREKAQAVAARGLFGLGLGAGATGCVYGESFA